MGYYMSKLFLVAIIAAAIIVGIITVANRPKSATPNPDKIGANPDAALQNPTSAPSLTPTNPPTQPVSRLLYPQSEWVTNATAAAIHTTKGDIDIQLYTQDAPKTVTNFATLAKKGYYDGLTFHRVVPGFVIQGGDPNGDGSGGYSIYGPTFADELNPNTPSYQAGYKQGVVAMANRGPNTNGSQFFIMLADNDQLPKNYTIFGKVTSGMDVVQKIVVGDKMTTIDIQ
jgi:cyclophilin family peptidyl-prolyl cis-trans isomerase